MKGAIIFLVVFAILVVLTISDTAIPPGKSGAVLKIAEIAPNMNTAFRKPVSSSRPVP